jgi:hypothetical protein
VSNETIPVIPNDEEQRSLRGSGLILSAATDDSDFTKTKEGYSDRLEGILDNPLSPENFSTYADDALDQVVKLADDMLTKSPYQGLPLPSGLLEDYISKSYGIDIGKVLDTLTSKVDETKEIKDYVDKIGVDNDIYVPPQVLSPKIESGKGEFTEAEVVPKLETILFLLKEMHGIDLQDSEQIVVTRGTVDKNMMRNEPYYSIQIPELNRTILVCNEKGNITYILDSEMMSESMPDLNLEITDLDKGAIDQLIKDNPSLGARIIHNVKYITKIEDSLDEIANFDEAAIDENDRIQEVSLLKEVEKAPDGYLSMKGIYKEMGIGHATLKDIISDIGDDLGDVLDKKFGTNVTPGYSPEQIEKIRARAESLGYFTEAPEGYLTYTGIQEEYGLSWDTIRNRIGNLGDDLGKPLNARNKRGGVSKWFSPEQIEKILVKAKKPKPTE